MNPIFTFVLTSNDLDYPVIGSTGTLSECVEKALRQVNLLFLEDITDIKTGEPVRVSDLNELSILDTQRAVFSYGAGWFELRFYSQDITWSSALIWDLETINEVLEEEA